MAKLYTGDMREREILKSFILSQWTGKTHYSSLSLSLSGAAPKKSG